ncbi:MAG: outer membrane protein OmpA-like peptidoglycan-associated protein [Cyclobacteriaceae bacterium]|jgi:outer membrane protein OmpA-like peptidoglycan-associated protein
MNRFFIFIILASVGIVANAQFFEKLPTSINSKQIEYAPSISADGRTIIYQSNKDGKYKLYIAQKEGSEWKSKPIYSINNYKGSNSLIAGSSISHDGNYIYFFASFPGSIGKEDIWYVERLEDDEWSEPINAGIAINTAGYEGFPSISASGNQLYFMRSTQSSLYPDKFCYKLFVSEKSTMGIWQAASALASPINSGCENCPRILPDNKTLLFASIRGQQLDPNFDLYMSRMELDGSWTEPKALDFLNTSRDELYGAIPAAGNIMIVNRKEGDNFDLFSLRVPTEFRPLTTVTLQGTVLSEKENLPIGAELLVKSPDHPTSQITSNAGDGKFTLVLQAGSTYQVVVQSSGFEQVIKNFDYRVISASRLVSEDIILAKKPSPARIHLTHSKTKEPLQATINIENVPITDFDNGGYLTTLMHGTSYTISIIKDGFESIIDHKTFDFDDMEGTIYVNYDLVPLKPELDLEIVEKNERIPIGNSLFLLYDAKRKKVVYQGTLADGTYEHTLELGHNYFYKALAQGYFYTEGQIDMTEQKVGGSIPFSIELVALRVGERLTVNTINFPSGSAELSTESKQVLNNIINVLAQNRGVQVEIAAFTDNVGDANFNLSLSQKRADAVKEYFVSQQVPSIMISGAKGYGEKQPVASNQSERGKAENRRVDFIVTSVN